MFSFLIMLKVVSSCASAVPRNASSWVWYNFQPAGMSSFLMTMLLTHFVQINSYHKITELQNKLNWKEPTRITESNSQTCTGSSPRVFSIKKRVWCVSSLWFYIVLFLVQTNRMTAFFKKAMVLPDSEVTFLISFSMVFWSGVDIHLGKQQNPVSPHSWGRSFVQKFYHVFAA